MTLEEKVLRNSIRATTTLCNKIALEMRLDKLLKEQGMAELKEGEIHLDLWHGNSCIKSTIMPRYTDMPDILKVNDTFYIRAHSRYDSATRVNYDRANEIQSLTIKNFI